MAIEGELAIRITRTRDLSSEFRPHLYVNSIGQSKFVAETRDRELCPASVEMDCKVKWQRE